MSKPTVSKASKTMMEMRKLAFDATGYYLDGTFETSELIYHLARFRKLYQNATEQQVRV